MGSVFDVYLAKRDGPGDEAYANLSLPASPYEILDALEKIRPDGPDDVDLMVEEYHGFSYLAPHILPQPDLYGLNALAEKLSELNEYEATAFHGLVLMEAGKQDSRLSIQRLLDLAYSTDCCHIVADAMTPSWACSTRKTALCRRWRTSRTKPLACWTSGRSAEK